MFNFFKRTSAPSIGSFQLENLVYNQAPCLFFDVGVSDLSALPSIYKIGTMTIQSMAPDQLLSHLAQLNVDKSSPLIALCDRGDVSRKLVVKLQKAGYINSYYLMGGARSLLKNPTKK